MYIAQHIKSGFDFARYEPKLKAFVQEARLNLGDGRLWFLLLRRVGKTMECGPA